MCVCVFGGGGGGAPGDILCFDFKRLILIRVNQLFINLGMLSNHRQIHTYFLHKQCKKFNANSGVIYF